MPFGHNSLPNPFYILALLLVALSCLVVAFTALVLIYPDVIPSELRSPTDVALVLPTRAPTRTPPPTALPSATPTRTLSAWIVPPTWTATPTASATATATATNTATSIATPTAPRPTATLTPTPLPPTPTGPTPTRTNTKTAYSFDLQNGTPSYYPNWANTAGCDWMGIAGQAFDLDGNPVLGLFIHIEGNGLNYDSVTGSKPAYGPGGYELYLGDHPQRTTGVYRLQLRTSSGVPLSAVYTIDTYSECSKNLIIVNFVQNH